MPTRKRPSPNATPDAQRNYEELIKDVKNADALIDKVKKGVLKGTHTLADFEAARLKYYRANFLFHMFHTDPRTGTSIPENQRQSYEERIPSWVSEDVRELGEELRERNEKLARINSPEYKKRAAERAKARKAKAAEQARVSKARKAEREAEREAEEAALWEAEKRLSEADRGLFNGTHTLDQAEAAARAFFTLRLARRQDNPVHKVFYKHKLDKERLQVVRLWKDRIIREASQGRRSLEEAEQAAA